jgi:phospholipid/cholesterol/gamma-HCH transport system permease protein
MNRVQQRLYGYALTYALILQRWRNLLDAPLRVELFRQIHRLGIAALPVICTVAAFTGMAAVTQVTALAGADSDAAQSWLFYGLYFELAPLMCALVVIARSSATLVAELGAMAQHGEYQVLQRFGVPASTYLVLPRVVGLSIALAVLTQFFQGVSMLSGWLAGSLLLDQPLTLVASHFLALADPFWAVVSLFKAMVMGSLIAVIACYHGSDVGLAERDLSAVTLHAVGNATVGVFVVDAMAGAAIYWGHRWV